MPENLENEIILEPGSGSGRFTTHAIKSGATIVSMDLLSAVEANYKNNGKNDNLLIVQGDLRNPPFFKRLF